MNAELGQGKGPKEAGNLRNAKKSFFSKRRNQLFIRLTVFVTLVLLIIVPIVRIKYLDPRDRERDRIREAISLSEQAQRYAVLQTKFPDPCLIDVNGTHYAFATRSIANVTLNVQVASADSIASWTLIEGYDALPILPPWVKEGDGAFVWAPQVFQRPEEGTFVLVYAAIHRLHPGEHCLGIATSDTILGPYDAGNSTEALLCHLQLGGIIDPTFFADPKANNSRFLIYKNDGNSIRSITTLQYSLLGPDWTTISSSSPSLALNMTDSIDNSTVFLQQTAGDGPNIESPQVWYREYDHHKRAYHLAYNAGWFADATYRTELLTCWVGKDVRSFVDCPWQQLKKNSTLTLLRTGSSPQPDGHPDAYLIAPGGPRVGQDDMYMAFHGDIGPDFLLPHGKDQIAVKKRATFDLQRLRQRALFIAELENDFGSPQGLKVKSLIIPRLR